MFRISFALLSVLLLITPLALAKQGQEMAQWEIAESRERGWVAAGDHVSWSWRTTERGSTEFGAMTAAGHEVVAALHVPLDLGMPEARGAKLSFAHPPEPVHVALWDNPTAAMDVRCSAAAACALTFPAGHTLTLVGSHNGHHQLRVDMDGDARGIVPCVRVQVDGDIALDGLTLVFVGQLQLSVPPEPVMTAA